MKTKKNRADRVLVFTTDAKPHPLQWLEYALKSARRCFGSAVTMFVCTDDPKGVEAVCAAYDARVVDVRDTIRDCCLEGSAELEFHGKHISPLQMFRLALPLEPAFAGYERVVFCDTDVEFLSPEWLSVFDTDLNGYDVAATLDCAARPKTRFESARSTWTNPAADDPCVPNENLERMRNNAYFAAGLMVMNLKRMREKYDPYSDLLMRMLSLCVRYKLPQLDQSLINLFFDIKEIPAKYNAWTSSTYLGEETLMRHYPGARKTVKWFYPATEEYYHPSEVDIVYTVGPVSAHDDQELKWSLRSIAKYGRNIGRVIVTSPVKRDWLSDEVIQVVSPDDPNAEFKHVNIFRSILKAVDDCDLRGEFLVSSDDHFYIRETDFANYPFYYRNGVIPSVQFKANIHLQTVLWKQSCIDTGKFLKKLNLPTVDFQEHCNSHWNADIVRDERRIFDEAAKLRYGPEPHVLMGNIWLSLQPGIPMRYRKDVKVKSFHGIGADWECFSMFERGFEDGPLVAFMRGEFGEKCRYERA